MKIPLIVIFGAIALTALYFGHSHLKQQPIPNLQCGFTSDFQNWLNSNGYSSYNFNRPDIPCAAFGGKSDTQKRNKIPVIFIHGNSDIGFGQGTPTYWQTGFRKLATYLSGQGWTKADLYTTTWGAANSNNVSNVYHSRQYIMMMRKFVEAVINYTEAEQVAIITHSMGVTLGRRVVKGGKATDRSGTYDVGPALTNKVKTFIGLAGANLGLAACLNMGSMYPTCSNIDGFNPGVSAVSGPSTFMKELNSDGVKEGKNVYTIWGQFDSTIGIGGLVWGKVTCRINDQDGQIKETSATYDHFALRDNTGPELIKWL